MSQDPKGTAVQQRESRSAEVDAVMESTPSDLNRIVVSDWVEQTRPFERVDAILRRTYEPQSALEIGNRARVSEKKVTKHLGTLEATNQVTTSQGGQRRQYRRAGSAIIAEHVHDFLTSYTADELANGIDDMKELLREWRDQYGVDSSDGLALEFDSIQPPMPCPSSDRICTAWLTTRRNLSLAQAALSLSEAKNIGYLIGKDQLEEPSLLEPSIFKMSSKGRAVTDDVASEMARDFGPVDAGALAQVRAIFTEAEPLVSATHLDDPLNPQALYIDLSDGIGDATNAQFEVMVNVDGDYAFRYTDNRGQEFKFDTHPRQDDIDPKHVHLPGQDSRGMFDSCIDVEEIALVTRAVIKLWSAAYDKGSIEGINDAENL